MKPHGPIPPAFKANAEQQMLIGGAPVSHWVSEAGDTPLFLYDAAMLTARAAEFRAAFPAEVQLHYAMKANPYPPLLTHMAALVDGFDVASGGEMAAAWVCLISRAMNPSMSGRSARNWRSVWRSGPIFWQTAALRWNWAAGWWRKRACM
jgi:hypothetical protein